MYKRVYDFLTVNNILYDKQFGFRKNHSTNLAIIEVIDKISEAMDDRSCTLGVFLDLSKAFDTLNHNILFAKLHHYGIRGIALEWFKSYFTNRFQQVSSLMLVFSLTWRLYSVESRKALYWVIYYF